VGGFIDVQVSGLTVDGADVVGVQGAVLYDTTKLQLLGTGLGSASTHYMVHDDGATGVAKFAAVDSLGLQLHAFSVRFLVRAPSYLPSTRVRFDEAARLSDGSQATGSGATVSVDVAEAGALGAGSLVMPAADVSAGDAPLAMSDGVPAPLRYGDVNRNGALDMWDYKPIMRWIVGVDSAPSFDSTAGVLANVFPANLPGLGAADDDWAPGWEANCTRRYSIADAAAIVLEMAGGSVQVAGELLPEPRAAAPTCISVPAVAPDTLPAWLYAPENILPAEPLVGGAQLRGVTLVLFRGDATQAQRAAAIARIGGTVIGGARVFHTDGFYYVRIPGAGERADVRRALDTLRSIPQVELALPGSLEDYEPSYRLPNDGSNWQKTDWTPDRNQADGDNWALEYIEAPRAWGCSTGSDDVKVAVIDGRFDTTGVAELRRNQRYYLKDEEISSNPSPFDSRAQLHGNGVAGVIAATGDNDSLATGVMWRAHLELFELRAPITREQLATPYGVGNAEMMARVFDAATRGAHIINISYNRGWTHLTSDDVTPSRSNPEVQELLFNDSAAMVTVLRRLDSSGLRPLIVLSAGNYNLDAEFGGNTLAKKTLPNQILVVGAHARAGVSPSQRNTWYKAKFEGTNHGSLVDLMAPGEEVQTLASGMNLSKRDGTSFAAPLVAGVAGLMKAFDSELDAAETKRLLLAGATNGGHIADGKPILNAYEALRAVSRRSGAPVCGNRVWSANGKVTIERTPGEPSGDENVHTLSAFRSSVLNVLHGGRTMRNDFGWYDPDSSTWEELRWSPVTRRWTSHAIDWDAPPPAPDGGTYASARGARNHDGDLSVWSYPSATGGRELRLVRWDSVTNTSTETFLAAIVPSALIPAVVSPRDSVPISEVQGQGPNAFHYYTREAVDIGFAFAPRGDRVVLTVTRRVFEPDGDPYWGAWSAPNDTTPPSRHVDSLFIRSRREGASRVIELDVATRAMRQVGTIDAGLSTIAVSESSDELVLTEYEESIRFTVAAPNYAMSPIAGGVAWRRIAFRPVVNGSLAATPARTVNLPATNVRDGQLPGTVAPLRARTSRSPSTPPQRWASPPRKPTR
jgi:hypothetical protein